MDPRDKLVQYLNHNEAIPRLQDIGVICGMVFCKFNAVDITGQIAYSHRILKQALAEQ